MENKDKMPKGIPYIIGNELAERFSYYGMRAILTEFMTIYLLDQAGNPAPMKDEESHVWFHLFGMANYLFPIIGALLADIFWGKYKTIIILSLVYCCGHLALSMDETRLGLSLGLTMIAIGSGGIKPCVSAHVGDQFNSGNKHLLDKVFNLFYLAINIGAAISMLLTPYLLSHYGSRVAFALPGLLMMLATVIFWFGRDKFKSVEPVGLKAYWGELKKKETLQGLKNLVVVYLFMIIFWSLYEQTGSSWVTQAKSIYLNKMLDLNILGLNYEFLRFTVIPSQIQSLNSVLVIIYVPLFAFWLYPFLNRFFDFSSIRKITVGFFLTALSFFVIAWIETQVEKQIQVSILWQALAYVILTAGEVLVYGTGLAFSYKQAPNSMKSLIMGLYMLTISMGNLLTAAVNQFIQNDDGSSKLAGASYYWFFVWIMLITSVLFIFVVKKYKEQTYVQED